VKRLLLLPCLVAAACVGDAGNPLGPSLNRAPQIRGITVTPAVVLLGGTAAVQVDALDPDGDRLFFRFSAEAGTVVADPAQPGRATYVQNGTDRPTDRITVTVVDTRNAAASASRGITLQGNRPPQVSVSGGGSCHPACRKTFTASASDPDGDPLAFLWSGCASGTERTAVCDVTAVGTVTATVVVSDGRGGLASARGEAEGTNSAPVVTGGADFAAARARFNVFYDDPDGDPLVCGWLGNCQCTGSVQSYNLDCVLPSGLASCVQRFSCTDPFGASSFTEFRLNP